MAIQLTVKCYPFRNRRYPKTFHWVVDPTVEKEWQNVSFDSLREFVESKLTCEQLGGKLGDMGYFDCRQRRVCFTGSDREILDVLDTWETDDDGDLVGTLWVEGDGSDQPGARTPRPTPAKRTRESDRDSAMTARQRKVDENIEMLRSAAEEGRGAHEERIRFPPSS